MRSKEIEPRIAQRPALSMDRGLSKLPKLGSKQRRGLQSFICVFGNIKHYMREVYGQSCILRRQTEAHGDHRRPKECGSLEACHHQIITETKGQIPYAEGAAQSRMCISRRKLAKLGNRGGHGLDERVHLL